MDGTPHAARIGVLERRLFLITLSALLPVVLLSYFLLFEEAQRQKRNTMEAARNLIRTTITAVDSELDHAIAALDVLAASPRLKNDDFDGFRIEIEELLSRRREMANIVLSTPQAQQLVNAKLPVGVPLPKQIDANGVAEVVHTKQPKVGTVLFSPVLKEYAFSVKLPVFEGDQVKYVLTAVMRPYVVQHLIDRADLPNGSVLTILDSNYKAVARTQNGAEWLGKPASASLLQLLKQGARKDIAVTRTLEGRHVYTLVERSSYSSWVGAIGIPMEMIDGPANRLYGMLAVGILISALVGLAVAFFIGRSITRPMKELKQAAAAIAQGKPPEVPKTGISEISSVGEALESAYHGREAALAKERQARQTAEAANRAKDEFLAMLSHELRNPLAPIHAAAQLLRMPGLGRDRIESLGLTIERQSNHLVRLVNDLLDASRVMRKLVTLQKEVVHVQATINEAIEQVAARAMNCGHELQVSLCPEPVHVLADRARLVQIVVNLLDNAIKYTPDHGQIRLELAADDETVSITVQDNGIGISDELMPIIFDLFQQSERSLARQKGGLGIGLSIVKGLVELHDGSITARTNGSGQGSEFKVEFKRVHHPVTDTLIAGSTDAASSLSGSRVMIVDDNKDAAATISLYLQERYACQVCQFDQPEAALEKAAEFLPDICILDIGMPGMDGFELVQHLKRLPALSATLFVALTGYGSAQDQQKAMAAGFDHHFTKPVDMEELVNCLACSYGETGRIDSVV